MVADNLAAELARKRISGREAAKALGVGQMYVARRVSGDVELSISDLFGFANLLGIDPAVLLHGVTPSPTSPDLRPTDYIAADSDEGRPVVDMFSGQAIEVAS